MILSPLTPQRLKTVLRQFGDSLSPWPVARSVFADIVATLSRAPTLSADLYAGHQDAVELAHGLGIATCDEAPDAAFSWDGNVIRIRTETAVLLHEIAHWQIAPPERRLLYDFGLGAGPETGRRADADAARCVSTDTQVEEEDLASLLGILWEVHLGGPALIAFCEQNWLELHDRPGTARHFASTLESLIARSLVDDRGSPSALNNVIVATERKEYV